MKYFLIVLGSLVLIIFIGYKIVNYWFIKKQEAGFEELAKLDFRESPRVLDDSLRMSNEQFWNLIEESKKQYPDNFDSQMVYLVELLERRSNSEIISFEGTLREQVIKLWNYNVKSLYQIIYGKYFSTDEFIYFRFWLISNGEKYVDLAINNPEKLVDLIYYSEDGEGLLYVADEAFIRKNGETTILKLPRDLTMDISYDFGSYRMTGEYINPRDFKTNYPKLHQKFK